MAIFISFITEDEMSLFNDFRRRQSEVQAELPIGRPDVLLTSDERSSPHPKVGKTNLDPALEAVDRHIAQEQPDGHP